ncbi:MAG TPA: hypothetical protein VEI03_00985 [Stellaceae bacterium]|nr:hypothetical protein [Stellaceae bacterium]
MEAGVDFGWMSLLQRRADYARKTAASARTPGIAKEFEDLTALYEKLMEGRVPAAPAFTSGDPKSGLIRHLQARASQFLMDARSIADKARADELRYLAGVFGAEAARLKNDAVR